MVLFKASQLSFIVPGPSDLATITRCGFLPSPTSPRPEDTLAGRSSHVRTVTRSPASGRHPLGTRRLREDILRPESGEPNCRRLRYERRHRTCLTVPSSPTLPRPHKAEQFCQFQHFYKNDTALVVNSKMEVVMGRFSGPCINKAVDNHNPRERHRVHR